MAYQVNPWIDERQGQSLQIPQNPSGSGMDTWRYGSPADIRKAQTASRGYSVSSSGPQSSRTVTRVVRTGSAPEKPDLPTYQAPEYDKRRVSALTQQEAAPGIRRLRESVQEIIGQPEENPNVKRMTLRAALQGYGTGLESVMAGAGRSAEAKYQTELNLQREEALQNWQAQVNAEMAAYEAAWRDYLSSGEQISETNYGAGAGGTGGRGVRLHGRYGGVTYFN